jgi:hypothetical protein
MAGPEREGVIKLNNSPKKQACLHKGGKDLLSFLWRCSDILLGGKLKVDEKENF